MTSRFKSCLVCVTGEFRAKSGCGEIDACQYSQPQRDSESGAPPGQAQEVGKQQQRKKQTTLNHSRSPVDDGDAGMPPDGIVPGRIDGKQNTHHQQ